MKQPHEGVAGRDHTDLLLSLDDAAILHREMLMNLAQLLFRTCLAAGPAPTTARVYRRITAPKVGDLVTETSAIHYSRTSETRFHGLGILLDHRTEWMHTDEEWASEDPSEWGDERPTDEAWYVQYGPSAADVCRWTNCTFLVVPTNTFRWHIGAPPCVD